MGNSVSVANTMGTFHIQTIICVLEKPRTITEAEDASWPFFQPGKQMFDKGSVNQMHSGASDRVWACVMATQGRLRQQSYPYVSSRTFQA